MVVRKMAVGPSAPPMIPIDAASWALKPASNTAPRKLVNMPNWAPAPIKRDLGLAIRGPKSVMAPTPMKIKGGRIPILFN